VFLLEPRLVHDLALTGLPPGVLLLPCLAPEVLGLGNEPEYDLTPLRTSSSGKQVT